VRSPFSLAGIATATIRRYRPAGEPWVPAQRLGLAEGVGAYTRGVAYQAFAEADCGTLEVGHSAELVLLAEYPAEIARAPGPTRS
jgi:predicted amidohydrolase YtcJ